MGIIDRVLPMPEKQFQCRSCMHYKKDSLKIITPSGKTVCQSCVNKISGMYRKIHG